MLFMHGREREQSIGFTIIIIITTCYNYTSFFDTPNEERKFVFFSEF